MTNTTQIKKTDVLVIDYGVGNHQSVINALKILGYTYTVSFDKKDIESAERYILPGVGAFGEAMMNLNKRDIIGTLKKEVLENKKPLLGICLGMQVLAEDSLEDGLHTGLGFILGHVVRIRDKNAIRVPHVGWNEVNIYKRDPLFSSISKGTRFYFDHSYHFETEKKYIAATCSYGEEITAAVQHKNIYGIQFHPEKSQTSGLRLIRAFMESAKVK